jgi:putative holliday junction resolvase
VGRGGSITAAMPLHNMTALRAALTPGLRLLGIDPGRRVIGLALSDAGLRIATPFGSLRRAKLAANASEVAAIASRQGVGGLVVGLPLEMDGGFGPAAQGARDWALALSAAIGLPAAGWDERLSSVAVNRMMIEEADLSRARRARRVDSLAAAWILQGALDALNNTALDALSNTALDARNTAPAGPAGADAAGGDGAATEDRDG